jgi:hypothetical protein
MAAPAAAAAAVAAAAVAFTSSCCYTNCLLLHRNGANDVAKTCTRHNPMTFFTPEVLTSGSQAALDDAADRYAQAAGAAGESAAVVQWNTDTAQEAAQGRPGGGPPSRRDFILAKLPLSLAPGESVLVTARWRRAGAPELAALGCRRARSSHRDDDDWVEQRSLRFGDALDPPENTMIVGQPCVCQKLYMRASLFVVSLLSRPPSRLLLLGVGAGQLVSLWQQHLPPPQRKQRTIDCVELHPEVAQLGCEFFDALGGGESSSASSINRAAGSSERLNFVCEDALHALRRGDDGVYDVIVVDLPVAALVDGASCSHLRRLLRPGGVCVHNYNFAGEADYTALAPLAAAFEQVHRLVLSASNTLLFSSRSATGGPATAATSRDNFPALVEQAVSYPYAAPLLFDLRADLLNAEYDVIQACDTTRTPSVQGGPSAVGSLGKDFEQRCATSLERIHTVGKQLGTAMRNTTRKIQSLQQMRRETKQPHVTSRPGSNYISSDQARSKLVETLLLRKILAADRGCLPALARVVEKHYEHVAGTQR